MGAVRSARRWRKPGRRFQVVDATLDAGGRRACLARAVRLRRADLPDAAAAPPVRAPSRCRRPRTASRCRCSSTPTTSCFYPDATEIRHVGGELGSGAAAAWIRLRGELVAGRRAVAAGPRRGGGGLRQRPELDPAVRGLAVRQHRADDPPAARAAGRVDRPRRADGRPRARGIGLSTGVLHDLGGPVRECARRRCSSTAAERRFRKRVATLALDMLSALLDDLIEWLAIPSISTGGARRSSWGS